MVYNLQRILSMVWFKGGETLVKNRISNQRGSPPSPFLPLPVVSFISDT